VIILNRVAKVYEYNERTTALVVFNNYALKTRCWRHRYGVMGLVNLQKLSSFARVCGQCINYCALMIHFESSSNRKTVKHIIVI